MESVSAKLLEMKLNMTSLVRWLHIQAISSHGGFTVITSLDVLLQFIAQHHVKPHQHVHLLSGLHHVYTVEIVCDLLIQYLHSIMAAQCRAAIKPAALDTRIWVTPVSRSRSVVLAFVICNWKCTMPAPSGLAKTDTVIRNFGYIFR